MGFCTGLAQRFLIFINVITGILGLAIAVMGGLVLGNVLTPPTGDINAGDGLINQSVVLGVTITGAVILVISFIGCIGALKQSRVLLLVYMGVMFVLIICQLAVGGTALSMSGNLDTITAKAGMADTSKKLSEDAYKITYNYMGASYNICCLSDGAGADWNANPSAELCDADTEFGNGPEPELFWEKKDGCTVSADDDCRFGVAEALESMKPSEAKPFCMFWHEIDQVDSTSDAEKNIVDPKKTGCGHCRPGKFIADANEWLTANIKKIGVAACGVGGVEFLALLFGCMLLCTNKDEFEGDV